MLNSASTFSLPTIYGRIVCFDTLGDRDLRQTFARAGLFSALSLSSAHLAVVEIWLTRGINKTRSTGPVDAVLRFAVSGMAIVIGLASGLHIRYIRLALHFAVQRFNTSLCLRWTRLQEASLAGFAAVLFCNSPAALSSLSLGWAASIALLILPHRIRPSDAESNYGHWLVTRWKQAAHISILLFPLLLPVTLPSLLGWLFGILIGPLIILGAVPATFLTFVIPSFVILTDPMWQLILRAAEMIVAAAPAPDAPLPLSPTWIGAYLGVLTAAAHLRERAE